MLLFWLIIFAMMIGALIFIFAPLLYAGLNPADTTMPADESKTQNLRWLVFVVTGLTIPLVALSLYLKWGSSNLVAKEITIKNQLAAVAAMRATLKTPQQIIAVLKAHVEQNPNIAQGWYLLGRIYMSQQQTNDAIDALAHAYALQPKNPQIVLAYVQALYFGQHSLQGKPTQLLLEMQRLDPKNDMAINLLAVAAYERKDYGRAISYWEQLLPNYAPDSPDGAALLKAIANAQAALAKK